MSFFRDFLLLEYIFFCMGSCTSTLSALFIFCRDFWWLAFFFLFHLILLRAVKSRGDFINTLWRSRVLQERTVCGVSRSILLRGKHFRMYFKSSFRSGALEAKLSR